MDHQMLPACVWLYPWVWRLCQVMHSYLWQAFNMCSHAICVFDGPVGHYGPSYSRFTDGHCGSKNFYQLWSSRSTVGRNGTSAGMQRGKCEESAYLPHLQLCEAESSNLLSWHWDCCLIRGATTIFRANNTQCHDCSRSKHIHCNLCSLP